MSKDEYKNIILDIEASNASLWVLYRGLLWQILGNIIAILIIVTFVGAMGFGGALIAALSVPVCTGFGWVSFKLKNRGRRLQLLWKNRKGISISEKPVVYLRSFKSDLGMARQNVGKVILSGASLSDKTLEEMFVDAFYSFGPFVTVISPEESVPQTGAVRFFMTSNWKNEITSLMQQAVLVVLRASDTTSVLWELQQAIKILPPERFLLHVEMTESDYSVFRTELAFLPHELPEKPVEDNMVKEKKRRKWFRNREALEKRYNVIYQFSEDWFPTGLVIPSEYYSNPNILKNILDPVAIKLGINIKKQRKIDKESIIKIGLFAATLPVLFVILLLIITIMNAIGF